MAGFLLDENLSEAVVRGIADLFPRSTHVRTLGLGGAPDEAIWEAARSRDLVLLTRDYDFQALSLLRGCPPKVVHLDAFNPSNARVIGALRGHAAEIERFAEDADENFLTLRIG